MHSFISQKWHALPHRSFPGFRPRHVAYSRTAANCPQSTGKPWFNYGRWVDGTGTSNNDTRVGGLSQTTVLTGTGTKNNDTRVGIHGQPRSTGIGTTLVSDHLYQQVRAMLPVLKTYCYKQVDHLPSQSIKVLVVFLVRGFQKMGRI